MLPFNPFEVSTAHLVYTCLGGFVVVFSMFSALAKDKLYIGEVVFGTIFGIIIGPSGLNLFTPRSWGSTSDEVTNEITLEVMRIVLAIGVFAIGVELPKAYLAIHWKSLALTVVPVMAWGWLISAGLIVAIFPRLTYLSALVVSACLTPTDPILAAAVISGRYADEKVPDHIKKLLAAESAANDGLAYPFLFFALYLSLEASTGVGLRKFFTIACLYQVVLGVIVGSVVGYFFSKLMKRMERKGFIGADSYAVQFVALALFTIGIVTLLGSDDLLAAFAAGSAVSWDGHFNERNEDSAVFASIIEVLLNCVVFVFIGSWIRFSDWTLPALGITPARLAAFFCSILFLRRIPPLMLLYKFIPDIHSWREALFCGWYGPMGVGAVFISTLALTNLPEPERHYDGTQELSQLQILATLIQPIVAFSVLGSILVHGLSIPAVSIARQVPRTLSVTTFSRTITGAFGSGAQSPQPEWANMTFPAGPAGEMVLPHRAIEATSSVVQEGATENGGGVPDSATQEHGLSPCASRARTRASSITEVARTNTPTVQFDPAPRFEPDGNPRGMLSVGAGNIVRRSNALAPRGENSNADKVDAEETGQITTGQSDPYHHEIVHAQ